MGRECFEALSHHECQEVYDQHQKEIIEKAKHNFQVCLIFNLKIYLITNKIFYMNRSYYWNMLIFFIIIKLLLQQGQ